MNFYFFDAFGEDKQGDTSFYLGRWFFMQPLRSSGGLFGGIYALPDIQPNYDFEDSQFSFWIGPEVGKQHPGAYAISSLDSASILTPIKAIASGPLR